VSLAGYRGKPLVVSLIYTSCYHVCPTITQSLAHAVEVAEEALGEASFQVATVGFDAAVDSPERMATFAREQGIDHPGWRFLSADAATIEELSTALGFIFYRSPKGFDHLTQTTIIDSGGTVYRQVYGDTFPAPRLVEPLNQPGTPVLHHLRPLVRALSLRLLPVHRHDHRLRQSLHRRLRAGPRLAAHGTPGLRTTGLGLQAPA
jgi:hypothetical protein